MIQATLLLGPLLLALSPFSSVEVVGDVHVIIDARGNEASAAEESATGAVKLEVKDRVLHVVAPATSSDELVVRITAPMLNAVRVSGTARAEVDKLDAKAFEARAGDATHLSLKGRCASLKLSGGGSTRISAGGLTTADARVVLERAAHATVAPTGSLDIELTGASVLTVTTRPKRVTKKTSAAARLRMP